VTLAGVRRRLDWGTRLVLHLAGGWWLGFLTLVALVDGLGVPCRMTPPRGDNWAGVLGMTAAAFLFLRRSGLAPVARAALVTGLFGGAGFATATFLKLAEVRYVPWVLERLGGGSGGPSNWHSILEQTYGLFNGVGIGVALHALAGRAPPVTDEPRVRRWTEVAAVGFVLLGVTYLNLVKNVAQWVGQQAVPGLLYGVPARAWFDAGYAVLAVAVLGLLVRHLREPLPVVPAGALGRCQLLYVVLLWWVVAGNLMRAIPPFGPERLLTEGVVHLNAVCCTVLALLWPRPRPAPEGDPPAAWPLPRLAVAGVLALAAVTAAAWWGTRAMHGDRFVGHAGYHTRFGPDAGPARPQAGQPHP
jgi:hypothetical protein